jgi:hypothetical protein
MRQTYAVELTGSDQVILAERTVYRGFSVRETTAVSNAVLRVYDNASMAAGTVIDEISLLPNESAREYYNGGIFTEFGIYVEIVSGAVAGSIRYTV